MSEGAPALVLRTTPWRDHDLIVDLLGPERGRFAAVARGARRSQRRFGGALEMGTRIHARTARGRGGLPNLGECEVLAPLRRIREDLERIHHLAYVLEITRLLTREGEADAPGFGLVCGYLDALEAAPATAEGLALWELGMLAHHGYALRLGACVIGGGPPDAISVAHGGAVQRRLAREGPVVPVRPAALAALAALARGDAAARLEVEDQLAVRQAFAALWQGVTGRALRAAAFLTVASP